MGFDKEKMKSVLLYILKKCGLSPNVGKTVLFKLLYFSDFDAHEQLQKPITGETYSRIMYGPAPRHFDQVVKELEKEGKIKSSKRKLHNGKDQIRYEPLSNPDLSLLSPQELTIIDKVISKCGSMTAGQITALSHQDIPWRATRSNETIDYDLVFYRDAITSTVDE